MKVKLVSDGCYRYDGEPSLIGQVFNAVRYKAIGYDIKCVDLVAAGLIMNCKYDEGTALFFSTHEVEVIEDES